METTEKLEQSPSEANVDNWTCPHALDQLLKEYVAEAQALWEAWHRPQLQEDACSKHIYRICEMRFFLIEALRKHFYYVERDPVARDVARAVRDRRPSVLAVDSEIFHLLEVMHGDDTEVTEYDTEYQWAEARLLNLETDIFAIGDDEGFYHELAQLPVLILARPLDSESMDRLDEAVRAFSHGLFRATPRLISDWVRYERMRYAARRGGFRAAEDAKVVDLNPYRGALDRLPKGSRGAFLNAARREAVLAGGVGSCGGGDGSENPYARIGRLFRDAIRAVEAMHIEDEEAAMP